MCGAPFRTASARWSVPSSSSIRWGRAQFLAGQGMDVRPHPHIGLATVTYLFDGRVMHRDSEGNALEITPGSHEPDDGRARYRSFRAHPRRSARRRRQHVRDPELDRASRGRMRKPIRASQHFDDASPAGHRLWGHHRARPLRAPPSARHRRSACYPTGSTWKSSSRMAPARPLDADHEERAIYVVEGTVEVAGDTFEGPRLRDLSPRRPALP